MDLYAIRRRNAWPSVADLEAAAERSTAEGDKEGSGVRWIRTYVVVEETGELGSVCIYQGESPRRFGRTPTRRACPPTRSPGSPTPSSSGPTPTPVEA